MNTLQLKRHAEGLFCTYLINLTTNLEMIYWYTNLLILNLFLYDLHWAVPENKCTFPTDGRVFNIPSTIRFPHFWRLYFDIRNTLTLPISYYSTDGQVVLSPLTFRFPCVYLHLKPSDFLFQGWFLPKCFLFNFHIFTIQLPVVYPPLIH